MKLSKELNQVNNGSYELMSWGWKRKQKEKYKLEYLYMNLKFPYVKYDTTINNSELITGIVMLELNRGNLHLARGVENK